MLKASTDVKNIVGTNPPRIYRHQSAPQDTSKPYITWFAVTVEPINNLSDPPPADRVPVQVDCWHQTDSGVETLALAVRDALEQHGHMTALVADLRETETKLFRMGLQFDLWTSRG